MWYLPGGRYQDLLLNSLLEELCICHHHWFIYGYPQCGGQVCEILVSLVALKLTSMTSLVFLGGVLDKFCFYFAYIMHRSKDLSHCSHLVRVHRPNQRQTENVTIGLETHVIGTIISRVSYSILMQDRLCRYFWKCQLHVCLSQEFNVNVEILWKRFGQIVA